MASSDEVPITVPLATIGEQEHPQDGTARRRFLPILFAAWLLLIFGTSCTVVRPHEFFELVQRATGTGQDSMQRFMIFWGIVWYAVVKGWHVAEFAILTFLAHAAIRWWTGKRGAWIVAAAMAFATVFAISDEWHQSFVPDRYGTIEDVFIDTAGVALAGLILLCRSSPP